MYGVKYVRCSNWHFSFFCWNRKFHFLRFSLHLNSLCALGPDSTRQPTSYRSCNWLHRLFLEIYSSKQGFYDLTLKKHQILMLERIFKFLTWFSLRIYRRANSTKLARPSMPSIRRSSDPWSQNSSNRIVQTIEWEWKIW